VSSAAYEAAAAVLLRESGCTVRRWRSNINGQSFDGPDWGLEAPRPRGPVSFGVLAHEVAHHLLHLHGNGRSDTPRWMEEVEAEEWALAQFDRLGLPGRARYERSVVAHLAHTFGKAIRRRVHPDVIAAAAPEWWELARARSVALALTVIEDRARRVLVS
jgi:hypothetical protein